MSIYSYEAINSLNQDYFEVKNQFLGSRLKYFGIENNLIVSKSKEYFVHGVLRRLSLIQRCLENIFSIFPPARQDLLSLGERQDVEINLHAFFVNIHGILDNLAWVSICEARKENEVPRLKIDLFKKETQEYLPDVIKQYVLNSGIIKWHEEYQKDYRDALSHRIPLYVPPMLLTESEAKELTEREIEKNKLFSSGNFQEYAKKVNEQKPLGEVAPFIRHSFGESENYYLHGQVLVDYKTITALLDKYVENFANPR